MAAFNEQAVGVYVITATPFLPDGWHGVNSTDESPGSTVIVHE